MRFAKLSIAGVTLLQILLAAPLLCGLGESSVFDSEGRVPELVMVSLGLASISLTAWWAAAGAGNWFARSLAAFALAAFSWSAQVCFWMQLDGFSVPTLTLLTFCFLSCWCQIVLIAGLLNVLLQVRVRHIAEPDAKPKSQVQLWHLLAAMALASVLLGAARFSIQRMPAVDWLAFANDEWGGVLSSMFVDMTFVVAVILMALLSALTPRYFWLAIVLNLVAVAPLSWVEGLVIGLFDSVRPELSDNLLSNYVITAWIYLSLFLLRAAGWRWMGPPAALASPS